MRTKKGLNELIYKVIGAAIDVQKETGPGLLESVYQQCMEHELKLRGIRFESELVVPINYKGLELDTKLRCDLFIENFLVVEIKAVNEVLPIHEAQILTYLKLLEVPKALMLNFNSVHMYSEGQKTYVSELYRLLPN